MNEEQIKEIKNKNCAIIGKFKDEVNGNIINEVAAVKAKMYSVMIDDNGKEKQKSTAKGIARAAKEKIKHCEYYKCIFGDKKEDLLQEAKDMYRIESKNHEIKTIKQNKISLCTLDDKRYYIDSNNSRAIGHYLNDE